MGMCASQDNNEGGGVLDYDEEAALDAAEKAAEVADKLMEMAPEKEEVVEQRVDMVYEIFKEVMQRPRIKPVFDKHHPEAHIKKATDEEEHCEEAAVEAPKPAKKKKKRNDSDSSDSSDDSDDDSDDGEAAPVVRRLVLPPKNMLAPELVDMIELPGNVEVWQDVDELYNEGLDDIEELLARADEPADSAYPWCQAHFLACCKATGEKPPNAAADAPVPDFQYVTAIVDFRTSLSHLLRCPPQIRFQLSEDLCELYFNEEDPGPGGKNRIGLDLMVANNSEEALQKLIHMSDLGVRKVMNRLEELLLRDIIPGYFKAYTEVGAREDPVYPEEQACIDRNYPKKPEGEDEESDEDEMYQLDVIILKAENLKVMDADTGLSDPFVKVTLGDESFFTNVRRQTLNPYWGETAGHFKFEVDQEERKKMKLKVALYDDDDDGEAFIGQVKFAINELKKDGPYTDDLYDLQDEKGKDDPTLGQVYLKLRFGAPRDDDEQELDDLIFAPKLCKPHYPLTLGAIQTAATKIANARRVQLACLEVRGYRREAGEAGEAMEIAAKKIQRMYRSKLMWRKIMNFKKKMTEGGEFLKYSRKGVPNKTHVYCPPQLNAVNWKQVGSVLDMLSGDSIDVSEVKAVVLGRMTKSFLLHDQGKSQPAAKVNASFSIVTRDRSLDLECIGSDGITPERERSEWLDNFAFLLKDQLKESALMLLRH